MNSKRQEEIITFAKNFKIDCQGKFIVKAISSKEKAASEKVKTVPQKPAKPSIADERGQFLFDFDEPIQVRINFTKKEAA